MLIREKRSIRERKERLPHTRNESYFASSMVNIVPSVAILPIDMWFPHGYDVSRPSSSDQSISDALHTIQGQQYEKIGVSPPNDGDRTQNDRKVKEIDLPVWVEVEGDTRAAEDPADCVRRLDLEFVFLLGWRVADRDQQFLAGHRWC